MALKAMKMDEASKITAAINRLAAAIERLADAYLYVNEPDGEGEEASGHASLSDH